MKDIVPGLQSGDIANLTPAGDVFYFAARGPARGLWKTDLTPGGTTLVKDVELPRNIVDLGNGIVVFTARTDATGEELWRTDGTEAGTFLLKDIRPGTASPFPTTFSEGVQTQSTSEHTFAKVVLGNTLIFAANDQGSTNDSTAVGTELWRTDGTVAGTQVVRNIYAETTNPRTINSSNPEAFRVVGDTVLFTATDASGGKELWRTNGVPGFSGTTRVKDVRAGSTGSSPGYGLVMGTTLFYAADDGVAGRELWRSDGTEAGTSLVADINPAGSSSPDPLLVVGETLYFVADDGASGRELWRTDGTAAGTVRVADVWSGSGSSSPSSLKAMGSTVFFSATDGSSGAELWKTDGTAAGTVRVKDIRTGSLGSNPGNLTVAGAWLYFAANDGVVGNELWRTDGSEAGTVMVGDFRPGGAIDSGNPSLLTPIGSTLFFRTTLAVDGFGDPTYEMWRTDGTEAGTVLVTAAPGPDFQQPGHFTPVAGGLAFIAHGTGDDRTGAGIWRATEATTDLTFAANVPDDGFASNPGGLTAIGSTLLFSAGGGRWQTDGTEAGTVPFVGGGGAVITAGATTFMYDSSRIWTTDGTEAGTVQIWERPPGSFVPQFWRAAGSTLFFVMNDGVSGTELWKSDGTAAGTGRVKDIWPGSSGSNPQPLGAIGSTLYFWADDGVLGKELWKTDGTEAGTVVVRDIRPGGSGSNGELGAAVLGSSLFFCADDGTQGRELWKTDGTEAGTVLLKDIAANPNNTNSTPSQFTVAGETLFFTASTDGAGTELWKSDGTEAGTVMVKDIYASYFSSAPSKLRAVGSTLWFEATDGTGRVFWRTDGTEAGTTPLATVWPEIGTPTNLTTNGSLTHFVGIDPATSARTIWSSDGTEAGTVPLAEIGNLVPATAGSLVLVGSTLFFSATDGIAGQELWSIAASNPASATPPRVIGVFVRGGGWDASYLALEALTTVAGSPLGWRLADGADQLATASSVAWSNVNRVSVQFDRPIAAPAADSLQLISGGGSGNVVATPTAVALLAGGTVAEWTLPSDLATARSIVSIAAGGILSADGSLALDGEWAEGSSSFATGSGDGTAGGDFNFAFNVLIGDLNGNGTVNALDISYLRQRFAAVTSENFRLDVNGNNRINALDLPLIRQRLGSATGTRLDSLPAPTPPAANALGGAFSAPAAGPRVTAEAWAWFATEQDILSGQRDPKKSTLFVRTSGLGPSN